jgi:hypothetical protein
MLKENYTYLACDIPSSIVTLLEIHVKHPPLVKIFRKRRGGMRDTLIHSNLRDRFSE